MPRSSGPKERVKKRKREKKNEDEIDALFTSVLGKKQKTASLVVSTLVKDVSKDMLSRKIMVNDKDLVKVLGAIQDV